MAKKKIVELELELLDVDLEVTAKGVRGLLVMGSLILAALTLREELRKPRSERTWHGHLGGLVPYDLRPPTIEQVRESVWAPDDPRLLTDTAFGIGWGINVGRVVGMCGGLPVRPRKPETAGALP
jgi:hypothetical protein